MQVVNRKIAVPHPLLLLDKKSVNMISFIYPNKVFSAAPVILNNGKAFGILSLNHKSIQFFFFYFCQIFY